MTTILTAAQITNHALKVLEQELSFGQPSPAYYTRRHYGKYTIYNKDGWCVARGLSKEQVDNYMKLLAEEK